MQDICSVHPSWTDIIDIPRVQSILSTIESITPLERISPAPKLWFEWARLTPLPAVKVIIIGMDPYKEHAHGLAFSSLAKNIPPSLKNIFACITQHKLTPPTSGNLSGWAQQGVLLLNAALSTDRDTTSGSHYVHWESYTRHILRAVCQRHAHLCILLWGRDAQKMARPIVQNYTSGLVLEWIHPSPLAQMHCAPNRQFIHCSHFVQVNQWLVEHNMDGIQWDGAAAPAVETAVEPAAAAVISHPVEPAVPAAVISHPVGPAAAAVISHPVGPAASAALPAAPPAIAKQYLLERMGRANLVQLCRDYKLSRSGTKADLIHNLMECPDVNLPKLSVLSYLASICQNDMIHLSDVNTAGKPPETPLWGRMNHRMRAGINPELVYDDQIAIGRLNNENRVDDLTIEDVEWCMENRIQCRIPIQLGQVSRGVHPMVGFNLKARLMSITNEINGPADAAVWEDEQDDDDVA